LKIALVARKERQKFNFSNSDLIIYEHSRTEKNRKVIHALSVNLFANKQTNKNRRNGPMSEMKSNVSNQLMMLLAKVERESDLKNVKIINHAGMRIASAKSDTTDAEDDVASSNALIMLGNNFLKEVNHGEMREVILRAEQGYVIIQYISQDYMVYAMLSNLMRIGYYASYLRNLCKKFAFILSGNTVTDSLLKEIEAEKERERKARTLDFKEKIEIKKDLNEDKKALESLLSVLSEGVAEDTTLGAASNKRSDAGVVGIDKDLMFDLEKMLEPSSISQDSIQKARQKAKEMEEKGLMKKEEKEPSFTTSEGIAEEESMDDLLASFAEIQKPQTKAKEEPKPAKSDKVELPEDDLLSSLNLEEVANKFVETQKAETKTASSAKITVKKESAPASKQTQPIPSPSPQAETAAKATAAVSAKTNEPAKATAAVSAKTNEPAEATAAVSAKTNEPAEATAAVSAKTQMSAEAQEVKPPSGESKLKPEDYIPIYGIPIYEGEVPPRELEDIIEFQLHTEQEEQLIKQSYPAQVPEIPVDEFGNPIFDQFAADEYADIELEEDAMIDALKDLETKKKK
jgi:predicted regulator of Ras-like GTPase activity (Roadblock/LC7/MglB family)